MQKRGGPGGLESTCDLTATQVPPLSIFTSVACGPDGPHPKECPGLGNPNTLKIWIDNARSQFVSQITCISEISNRSKKSSNSRKIARTPRISMIFGPIESQRRDLFLNFFSNEQNKRKVFQKFVAVVVAPIVVNRFRRDRNRMPSLSGRRRQAGHSES